MNFDKCFFMFDFNRSTIDFYSSNDFFLLIMSVYLTSNYFSSPTTITPVNSSQAYKFCDEQKSLKKMYIEWPLSEISTL